MGKIYTIITHMVKKEMWCGVVKSGEPIALLYALLLVGNATGIGGGIFLVWKHLQCGGLDLAIDI